MTAEPHIHLPDGSCCAPSPAQRRFAHLHQHTQYSLLDGAAKLKDLLKWVKEVTPNDPSCAITDHGNMHGAVHFYNYATQMGVKPIIGYEAYVAAGSRFDRKAGESGEKGTFHLTLLARDFEGYQNLCRLSSAGYLEGYYYKPRIDRELLKEHSKGVIALSGCLGAEVPQFILQDRLEDAKARLLWYQGVFGDNYFIEVQDHGLPEDKKVMEVLRTWARELGIGMAATNDGHYVKKSDATAHETLLAIQTKATLADEKRFKFPCDEFYVKSLEEMQASMPVDLWGEEPFDNTAHIASLCNVDLPVGKKRVYQMPALPIPEGRTMAEELRVQTYRGSVRRYPQHVTVELLRHYAAVSWARVQDAATLKGYCSDLYTAKLDGEKFTPEKLAAMDFEAHGRDLHARLPNFNPATADAETLYTALAFMGSVWEALGKACGEKYTKYPALEDLEADPSFVLPGMDEATYRHALVLVRRAEYELSVINNMGFPDYFLIVADYINWAKDQGISVGPGRGSGAGSLVAYAIRITNLDPLEYELLFERFLNPDRISMPDFDIDFSDARREEVIHYVRRKYGDEKVAQIATFGTMASKACLKDVARVMGLEYAKVDKVSKLIPIKFGKSYSLEQARESVPDIEQMLNEDAQLREAYEFAQKLEGLTRHASVHAAGVVIGREALSNLVPLMRDTGGEGIVCQYDMKAVEDIGMIKMDFLGLRTLSFLEEAQRILRESKGLTVDFDSIPLDDARTYELMSRGDTKGVFQFEGAGIADATRRLKPRTLADIIALSALYRPGPMENIPTYVRRHHGQEQVDYVRDGFPVSAQWLEKILKETYGIPVYQEQIMQIASEVAGFSLGGADLLRRAMGKKDAEEMKRQRQIFVDGAKGNGVPKEEANKLFDLLDAFANYGFNKSHSAAYGVITYQTAWLKANHPVEFMAALLTVERRDSDKVAEYSSDARKMGVRVLPPDINRSGADFKVVGQDIYFGLYAIKGLGEGAVQRILEEREKAGPYRSLADFCSRLAKVCNRKAMENLIKSGAFDAFGERAQLIASVEEAISWAQGAASLLNSGMDALFGMAETAPEPKLRANVAPLGELEKLSLEKEALGLYISGHPLEQHEGLREAASTRIATLEEWFAQQPQTGGRGRVKAVLAGMIENVVKKPTKSGGMMARFNLADESATIELVAFSRAYERVQEKLVNDTPALVVVEIESEEGSLRVIAEEVVTVEQLGDVPKVMYVNVDLENASEDAMGEFQSLLDEHAGNLPTFFRFTSGEHYLVYQLDKALGSSEAMRVVNGTFPWAQAYLAFDQQSILNRFAPKPPAWANKQGQAMRA